MKYFNYTYTKNVIPNIISIILVITIMISFFFLVLYKKDPISIMKVIAENDGEIEDVYNSNKEIPYIFAVKIDKKSNILEIVNNSEFGVERDIYRIIRTDKENGVGYVKNKPIRYLKEKKDYGEIIIFYNRALELKSMKILFIITVLMVVFKGGFYLKTYNRTS